MALKRRNFLLFLGASVGTVAAGCFSTTRKQSSTPFTNTASDTKAVESSLSFQPVRGPLPLATDGLELTKQVKDYNEYEVKYDLVLPEGFAYDVIAAWGDKVGDSPFCCNNDYLSFIETGKDEGLLIVNFEYISSKPWLQTYEQVIGKSLPFAEIDKALKPVGKSGIDAFGLPDNNPTKAKIREVSKEAMIDLGMGVISIRREANGKWVRTNSKADRRITGISGLEDGRYLKGTRPAGAVFRKKGKGYDDKLGDRIIGTFSNCAGGTTPSGTVFSAQENFQKAEKDEQAIAFKKQFKTLGDLYTGNPQEKQGAILIDAHFAANAAEATCTARPEDTEIAPDGSLFISFTSGTSSSSDGGPDLRIFKDRDNQAYEYGWIVRLVEDGNNPAAMSFMFGYGPMECETTGPFFTNDEQTLFLSVQHPGEINGLRKGRATGYEDRKLSLRTPDGQEFVQTRRVPIGSNWFNKTANAPPKPAVVAIRRQDAQPITTAKLS